MAGEARGKARELVLASFDAAVSVSSSEAERFVSAARVRRSDLADAELLRASERSYPGLVATTGAAAGGVAAAPAMWLAGGAVAGTADAGAFTATTAVLVLAVASVHGIETTDLGATQDVAARDPRWAARGRSR